MVGRIKQDTAMMTQRRENAGMRVGTVCILGGTGFVGRHLAARLAEHKIRMRVLTRHRERNKHLLVIPTLDLIEADAHDPQVLLNHFYGCDAVVNLVAILNESGPRGREFRNVHVELPRKIISACRQVGVKRLLHMSALGAASDAPSLYHRTKAEGERLVLDANDEALATTTYRPSIIFGPEDHFFNRFAELLRLSPFVFPVPTPRARMSPVYVGDVVESFCRTLLERASFGQSYALCGPETFTLKQLVQYTARQVRLKRRVIGLSDGLSRLQAHLLGHLPGKLYSYDNYLSTLIDNVCDANGLETLGIHPTALSAVVPGYLAGFRQRRRYNVFRRTARRT
jgi:NADH dehydrogenase